MKKSIWFSWSYKFGIYTFEFDTYDYTTHDKAVADSIIAIAQHSKHKAWNKAKQLCTIVT